MIEDKWETDVTSGGRWERFKALYIKELQQLTDDDIGVDNAAMKAQQALIARVDAFESKYESDVQTLNDNQLHLETAFQASAIPSVVETTGTGTVSGSIAGTAASGVVSPTVLADLLREMRSLKSELHSIKNNRNRALTTAGGGGGGGGGGSGSGSGNRTGGNSGGNRNAAASSDEWRQWNRWCYSCGCNLNHESTDCPTRKRRKDHKDEATQANPMGGNTSRSHLWNKWCNPVTNKSHDNPE